MGWEVALAGSVIQGAGQVISGRAQAKAGEKAAAFEAAQLNENRKLAKISALDQEAARLQEYQRTAASYIARNPVAASSDTGRNLLATLKSDTQRDVSNIRLMGAAGDARYGTAIEQSNLTASSSRRAGSTAWVSGLGSVAGGAAGAARLDSTSSIYNRWFG